MSQLLARTSSGTTIHTKGFNNRQQNSQILKTLIDIGTGNNGLCHIRIDRPYIEPLSRQQALIMSKSGKFIHYFS